MRIKFETKSARVKGLAFHPKRKWLLASLHNGVIQLWDYSEKSMIAKYNEHNGPVRGVDFHKHQPLFVSGGDDMKIKVWNYKSNRCLFTLRAHEDYIRTTYFHHENPWILSASDDQSIRIWNWQSRTRIAVLTGHTHYVMCAAFHPSADLIVSVSIDQTMRVWDVSALKMKSSSNSMSPKEDLSTGLPEILSKTDYSVESKDAHNSEINWCAINTVGHKDICLTAADDSHIKIWEIDTRTGIRELFTLRGHYNNVNCAIFHPRKDIILSASEDRSIRVWDMEKKSAIVTHRNETQRFWTLAAHPKEDLFAAGHDGGLILFKLEHEKPAFTIVKDTILFIKGNEMFRYNMRTNERRSLTTLRPKSDLLHYYAKISCYSFEENQPVQVLVTTRSLNTMDNKSIYDLYRINPNSTTSEPHRGKGVSAIFVGRNQYAVLNWQEELKIFSGQEEKKINFVVKGTDIFEAGSGKLFVRSKANASTEMWSLESGKKLQSAKIEGNLVAVSDDKNYIAIVNGNKITLCDNCMNTMSTVVEQRKVKSVAWGQSGVLIYSTNAHVKYALTDGHSTTIVSLQQVLYVMAVREGKVFCIDKAGDIKQIPIDEREFKFKQAVVRNDRGGILAALRQLGSLTRAEITFLVQKGHPGLALKFVKDAKTKFPLALQAFDIDEALAAATQIDNQRCWAQLAEISIQVGHITACEVSLRHLKKPYKLAMLYLVSGQRDKMSIARDLAREQGDISTEFLVSLLMKDFTGCTKIILRSGYPNLAYTCAVNHGLYDLASEISEQLSEEQLMQLPPLEKARTNSSWMQSTMPEVSGIKLGDWPLLNDEQENYDTVLAEEPEQAADLPDDGDWGDEDMLSKSGSELKDQIEELEDVAEDGWDADEDPLEDLSDDDEDEVTNEAFKSDDIKTETSKRQAIAPNPGKPITAKWTQISDLPLHHVLSGSYQSAIGLLKNQIGLTNPEPLYDVMKDLFLQSRAAFRGSTTFPTTYAYPSSNATIEDIRLPAGGYTIEDLKRRLTECYTLFSGGKFSDAIIGFRNLLVSSIFLKVTDDDDRDETIEQVKQIISNCREYILGLQIWLERKNITGKEFEDHKRACELAAYFAKLNLTKHRSKVLEKAFEVFLVKPKEFQKTRAAVSIARRLLDYLSSSDPKKAKMVAYAEKIKNSFDAQVDQSIQLDYDDLNPYSLCAGSFRPIYSGNQLIGCPLCDAKYKPEFGSKACKVCLVSEIGRQCPGIKFAASSFDD